MSAYRHIRVEPVTGVIGAQVSGVELASLTPEQAAEVRDALWRHLVLFFRDQDLSDDEHLSFASIFGTPNVYPATRARGLDQPLEWVEDTAASPPKADLWHTDAAFLTEPPDVAVLNMRVTPPVGGDTLWVDLYAVYSGLSAPMRRVVDDLDQDLHPGMDFKRKVELQFGPGVYERVAEEFQGSRHPLVRVHPETGQPALFMCGEYVQGLAGMSAQEASTLLDFLRRGLDNPNVQCRWRWQQHDVAVWDERCTNHRGLADHYPAHRLIRRCTVGAGRPRGVSSASSSSA